MRYSRHLALGVLMTCWLVAHWIVTNNAVQANYTSSNSLNTANLNNRAPNAGPSLQSEEDETQQEQNADARNEHFFQQRAFPFGQIPLDWRAKALDQMRRNQPLLDQLQTAELDRLTSIGPTPVANGQTFDQRQLVAGRTTSLAMDPRNPNLIYLGSAQGGLWRSTDAGHNWQPLTDNAPTQAIGAIALDPISPDTIYLGTGEGNLSGDSFFGMGILKSTDAGRTWENLAQSTFLGKGFSNMVVDFNDPRNVYASVTNGLGGQGIFNPRSTRNGIYKSTDAGVSWNLVLEAGPPPFNASATDIEMDPTNAATLYAAFFGEGIFKTTDGGRSWRKLTNGLPETNFNRPEIGISRSAPNVLYAAFGDRSNGDLLGFFKSTDFGQTWRSINRPPNSQFGNVCQCFYDNIFAVDPQNPDIVYYGGVALYRSTNGGRNWEDISEKGGGLHPDFHAIIIDRENPQRVFVGNDGGIWSSLDRGNTWTNLNQTLSTLQFISIASHPTDPNIVFGGTQDNGTNRYFGMPQWDHVDDGDGGFVAVDQSNPNVVYHTFFNRANVIIGPFRSVLGGRLNSWVSARSGIDQTDRVLFYAPFILDPNQQSRLYFGTFRLFRSENMGQSWVPISSDLTDSFGAISAIHVPKGSAQTIYTGSSDGVVNASRNNGRSFTVVTDNLPRRYISDIVTDPTDPQTVYVSLSGFQSGHIFKSTTGGGSWQDVSGNLPDVPANALAINPSDPQNLILGTDLGVFQTFNGGQSWMLVEGMPKVSVFDIDANVSTGLVRVATHGRGLYEMKLAVRDAAAPTVQVTAPTSEAALLGNTSGNVVWQSRDDIGISSHDVTLSTDGGQTFPITLARGLPGSDRSLTFTVPPVDTARARIKVTVFDVVGKTAEDINDQDLVINTTAPEYAAFLRPTRLEVSINSSTNVNVQTQRFNGFTEPIILAVRPAAGSNLTGITATLSTTTLTTQTNSLLNIQVADNVTPGERTLEITTQTSSGLRVLPLTINIAQPDFTVAFANPTLMIARGARVNITLQIQRIAGFSSNVTVEAPALTQLNMLRLKLTPATTMTTGNQITFSLMARPKGVRGNQTLTFTARDASGRVRTANLNLIIQ
jgi:photosystem II stability/assembly factor-like uncharacterized protein